MGYDYLCKGCFADKGIADRCPFCGFAEAEYVVPPFSLLPGIILNRRYIVGKVLGSGGFGITYICYDTKLEFTVAIKEYLPKQLALRSSDSVSVSLHSENCTKEFKHHMESFIREAKALAKFNNESGIVSIQDIFEENGTAYIVMYYVNGITLEEYAINNGNRLPPLKVLQIMSVVMESLKKVHKEGIIHRDISPDNIYITTDNEVKLLDFGAARYFISDEKSTVSVVLKRGYAPLEQYYDKKENQGPWTDIYSIAATMYRTVTGVKPAEALERIGADQLKSPRELGIEIPDQMESAIMKGLRLQFSDRPKTLEEFIRLLMPVEITEIMDGFNPAIVDGQKRLSVKKAIPVYLGLAALITAGSLLLMLVKTGNGDGKLQDILTVGDMNANPYALSEGSVNTVNPSEMPEGTSSSSEGTAEPAGASASPGATSESVPTQTPEPTTAGSGVQSAEEQLGWLRITEGIIIETDPETLRHTISVEEEKLPAGLPDMIIVGIVSTNDVSGHAILAMADSFIKDPLHTSFQLDGRTGPYYRFADDGKSYEALLLFDGDMNFVGYYVYRNPKKSGTGSPVSTPEATPAAFIPPALPAQPEMPVYNHTAVVGSSAPSHVRKNIDDIYVVSVKPAEGLTDGDEPTMTVTFEYNLITQDGANINICVNNGNDPKGNIENSRLVVSKGRGVITLSFPALVKYWTDGTGVIVNAYISKFDNSTLAGSNWITIPIGQKK